MFTAQEARQVAGQVHHDELNDILVKIKDQALKGKFSALFPTMSEYTEKELNTRGFAVLDQQPGKKLVLW